MLEVPVFPSGNNSNNGYIKVATVYVYFQGQMVDFSSHETAGVCVAIDIHAVVTQHTLGFIHQPVSKSWCLQGKHAVTDSEQRKSSDMFCSYGVSAFRRPSLISLKRPNP